MQLRRPPSLLAIAALLLTAPAVAQTLQLPASYVTVAVTLPAPSADPSFAAFRAAIVRAAKARIYAELEALVQPQGFFWDRDFGQRYDPRRPPIDNLAAAVELEHRDGVGWDRLANLAGQKSAAPLDSRPGVVCAPARPGYDAIAFSRLLEATYTRDTEWAYPMADATPVRAAPAAGAPAIGTLTPHFVRLLGFEGAEGAATLVRNQWARIMMPDGKIGYVAPGTLSSLTAERLCYAKDMVVGWRIAGYIAGGN
jgi:hypothetical protein